MLLAWAELMDRAQLARDAELAVLIRSQHYDEKGFKKMLKRLEDQSE